MLYNPEIRIYNIVLQAEVKLGKITGIIPHNEMYLISINYLVLKNLNLPIDHRSNKICPVQ